MASKTARQGQGAASGNEEEGVRGGGPSKGHRYGLEGHDIIHHKKQWTEIPSWYRRGTH